MEEIRNRNCGSMAMRCSIGFALCTFTLCFLLPLFADHEPEVTPLPQNLYAEDLAVRAFGLVEHQLRAATTQEDTGWVSQPGAVRTFREDGSLSRIYKLYSAPDLLASSAAEVMLDLPGDWDSSPARFVDLNEPMMEAGGGLRFPIADPRVQPEGFSYQASINGVVVDGAADQRRLPMPVQWIYLLQDGTRGYLDDGNRFIGTVVPTLDNPIVGRIAYWADDNTAKVNINTASEGVFWDFPRTDTVEDRGLADSQPAEFEYQRHPGHPATVSLSSVIFPGRRIGTPEGGTGAMSPLLMDDAELLWWIGNGIGNGGSKAGTLSLDELVSESTAFPSSYAPYESIDDVFDRRRAMGIGDDPVELEQRLERSGFFLTTDSNAPELNLRGYPRMSTWPIDSNRPGLQPDFDVIASPNNSFGGTDIYALSRQSEGSRHGEFYTLHRGNNAHVFNYLKLQTGARLPGFGGSLAEKFGVGRFEDRDQILAMMFDHVRGINLEEPRKPFVSNFLGFSPSGQVSSLCLCGGTSAHQARWNRPEFADPYAGGRIFTVSEVALVFFCSAWRDDEGNTGGNPGDDLAAGKKRISIGLVAEVFCPAHGHSFMAPEIGVRVSGVSTGGVSLPPDLQIDGQTISQQTLQLAAPSDDRSGPGGHGGADRLLFDENGQGIVWESRVDLDIEQQAMQLSVPEVDFQLIIYDVAETTSANVNNAVQTFRLKFPSAQLPAPTISTEDTGSWDSRLARVLTGESELITENDVVRSLVVGHGDYRLVAGTRASAATEFQPHPDYNDGTKQFAHSLLLMDGSPVRGATFEREMIPGANVPESLQSDTPLAPSNPSYAPRSGNYPFPMDPVITGDFDNGFGNTRDGPYLNRGDDGVLTTADSSHYFERPAVFEGEVGRPIFSPHRIMPGPVMFGSIPSGVRAGIPWRTLLFRPDPSHFGASSTPDHLWLDFFRMPAPLPYRSSGSSLGQNDWKGDEFSSDGKINLNYQTLPFAHIERATAIHAALKSEKMMAIPTGDGAVYKLPGGPDSYRHFIDPDQTLQQWESKFSAGDVFRSASQICEMYLVPEGQTLGASLDGDYPAMRDFWSDHKLTGDNTKERPYAALYQHFTTRSNSFDVHVIAQTIEKSEASDPAIFDPILNLVGEEYRGSGTLRRRLDPASVPQILSQPLADPLDELYGYELSRVSPPIGEEFRIIEIRLTQQGFPQVTWQSRPSHVYVLQRSTDMALWADVATVRSASTVTPFLDTTAPSSATRLFYRVIRN